MKTGAELITEERLRQISVEGYSTKYDDLHDDNELIFAAVTYASHAAGDRGYTPCWPWGIEWWKPSPDPIRDLTKAGALIAAEIDRLQRRAAQPCRAQESE